MAKKQYDTLINDASHCANCKACVEKCPQRLDIPNVMKDISIAFRKEIPAIDMEAIRIKWPEKYKKLNGAYGEYF